MPAPQLSFPAVYMRGGTSKGVFFLAHDLPADPTERDRLLMRVIGSPDRYGKHTDMSGADSVAVRSVTWAPREGDWLMRTARNPPAPRQSQLRYSTRKADQSTFTGAGSRWRHGVVRNAVCAWGKDQS